MKKNGKLLWAISLVLLLVTAIVMVVGCGQVKTTDPAKNSAEEQKKETASPDKYKFALVKGAVHPYFDPWAQGAKDAAKDFGIPAVEVQAPQHWNQNEQNVVLDGLVAKGYKGIALMPSDPVAGNEEISKMVDNNVFVIALAGAPAQPSKAKFTLATDVSESAYQGAKRAIEAMGKKGNLVHLTGQLTDTNTKKRMDAVKKAVEEAPDVKLLQTITDIDVAEPAQNAVSSLLAAKKSQINGIICTAYIPSVTVATQLRQLNEKNIKAVGIDTDKIVIDAIKDGFMLGTMSQNPYGQAYIGLYSFKLLADGYKWKSDAPAIIDSGSFFINKDNSANYEQGITEMTKKLMGEWKDKYFSAP
ncbi:sugar ABC transporter substrate-binding protein [Desulfosporosinus sp. BICA1-9]|uniref:sugar ABC transporter substrate-binding protein n=1 Tax=Desulfosporosinus sp. BICA1-9 TaxID=1531958 RepID=UPI000ACBF486|nr:sugar ABC transporter substrate-binding protein [Desulfosporosinus sp. BICA1-9]